MLRFGVELLPCWGLCWMLLAISGHTSKSKLPLCSWSLISFTWKTVLLETLQTNTNIWRFWVFIVICKIVQVVRIYFCDSLYLIDIVCQLVCSSDVLVAILRAFFQAHLPNYGVRVLRVMETVAKRCPRLISRCNGFIKEGVKAMETKRGVGHDKTLRLESLYISGFSMWHFMLCWLGTVSHRATFLTKPVYKYMWWRHDDVW